MKKTFTRLGPGRLGARSGPARFDARPRRADPAAAQHPRRTRDLIPASLQPQLITLLVAACGGAALRLLHVPLAWMIGAMLGTALLGWFQPAVV